MTLPAARQNTEIEAAALCLQQGQAAEALALVDALLKRDPSHAEAWNLKGGIFHKTNNKAAAISCFVQAVKCKEDFKAACLNLAHTLDETGQTTLAIKAYEHLLRMEQIGAVNKPVAMTNPAELKEAQEWFNKGQQFLNCGDWENAANAFREMLTLYRDSPEALTNLGKALIYMRRSDEAEQTLIHCLHVKPGYVEALSLLGNGYFKMGQNARAIAAWQQAVASDPTHLATQVNLAKTLSAVKLYDEAIKVCEHLLRLDPQNAGSMAALLFILYHLCRWEQVETLLAQTEKSLQASAQWVEPFFVVVYLPYLLLENNRRYAANFFPAEKPYDSNRPLPATVRGNGKLRIGYLSADFYGHATAYLISEMFEHHDRTKFDIYAYSHGPHDGGMERSRIMKSCTVFRDIHVMNDHEAAELIRGDGIDILVDLKGFTKNMRLSLMALRPAPVQMHYLGFPGTMAMNSIDYFISDSIVSPPGSDAEFSEKLIRLPHSYQINDRMRPLPVDVPPRASYGLPEEGFVFCDFNDVYKITPDVFDVWVRLLKAVEGSVLWVFERHAEATKNLRLRAQKSGIDPARIIAAPEMPLPEHLARYRHVDLFLDTLIYNGHTTVSDALWCGTPAVTLAGNSFARRVAASLLNAVGLPELITNTLEEYEALALSIARDKKRLSELRKYLEQGRMSFPLFDSMATTRAIEAAYVHAAELHRGKKSPEAFTLAADLSIA